ncbi:hypothetical protein DDT56_09185 [Brenneria corticis]|uniref:Uncharacterized protein n=1 Tax=Brenneria corticis TaxID=2173106 RepID=A0A2U1U5I8_9GAMM|nr:hypothetical protein DDT56_09185 [Brenneria sp. CFCC 11842]
MALISICPVGNYRQSDEFLTYVFFIGYARYNLPPSCNSNYLRYKGYCTIEWQRFFISGASRVYRLSANERFIFTP